MLLLVVDDNDMVRRTIARMLRRAGHIVIERDSPIGVSAVALREKPDAILLDYHMPAMRGDSLVAVIKKNPSLQSLPIILISAMENQNELISIADQAGVNAVVPKTLINQELIPAVERAVAKSRHATSAAKQ